MTNKVQKIREEVEKRFEQIKNSKRESDSGAFYQLKELLEFIDSMQEEPVSEDKMTIRKEWFEHCKKSWYNEGYIDGYIDGNRQFEESVSEELEEEIVKRWNVLHGSENPIPFDTFNGIACHFATWQKQQDQSTIELAEDHAILAGMKKMKEEMTEKAVEGIARPDDNEIWCDLDSFNIKDGDKCRVIVIKED